MGRGREPVVPGVRDTPGWKVRAGGAVGQKARISGGGLDWDPDVTVEEDELGEAEIEAGDSLFSEEDFQQWNSRQAVLWIANAANAFEVLGFRPKPLDGRGGVRRRYYRLSLLTHPDKSQDPDAGPAFQKLSHAMRILTDDEKQHQLLQVLFPRDYGGMSEGELRLAANANSGMYETAKTKEEKGRIQQAAAQAELEGCLKQAVKEREQLKQADEVANERFKKRGALASLAPSAAKAADMADREASKCQRRACVVQQEQAAGKNPWGLPSAFLPASSGSTSSAAVPATADTQAVKGKVDPADPNALWQQAGTLGLAANGWERLESRSHPGHFYFLHSKTGRTVLSVSSSQQQTLVPGWERRQSRTRPGVFYFVHLATGETCTELPAAAVMASSGAESAGTALPASGTAAVQFTGARAFSAGGAPATQGVVPESRQPWPWEAVPDAPDHEQSEKPVGQDRSTAPPLNAHSPALFASVQAFLREHCVDERAGRALLAAKPEVQRRIVEGWSFKDCDNPSAVLMTSLRRFNGPR